MEIKQLDIWLNHVVIGHGYAAQQGTNDPQKALISATNKHIRDPDIPVTNFVRRSINGTVHMAGVPFDG